MSQFNGSDFSNEQLLQNEGEFSKITLPAVCLFNIIETKDVATKSGAGVMFQVKLEVAASSANPADVGKRVPVNFNLMNNNAETVRIARTQLAHLLVNTIGIPALNDANHLVGQQFIGACIEDGDFMRMFSFMNRYGMEVIDAFGNVREPKLIKEPALEVERAKLLAQLNANGAAAAQPTQPVNNAPPAAVPPTQQAALQPTGAPTFLQQPAPTASTTAPAQTPPFAAAPTTTPAPTQAPPFAAQPTGGFNGVPQQFPTN